MINTAVYDDNYKIKSSEIIYNMIKDIDTYKKENGTHDCFIADVLIQMKAMSCLSENILQYSRYIPLRLIAQEIIDEKSKREEQFADFLIEENICRDSESCAFAKRDKYLYAHFLKKLPKESAKISADESYMKQALLFDRISVKRIKNAEKCCKDYRMLDILNSLCESSKIRISKLKYLISANQV